MSYVLPYRLLQVQAAINLMWRRSDLHPVPLEFASTEFEDSKEEDDVVEK